MMMPHSNQSPVMREYRTLERSMHSLPKLSEKTTVAATPIERVGGGYGAPGALKISNSMQSLFDRLSDAVGDAENGSPTTLKTQRHQGNNKYYHLSFIEHVEKDDIL